MLGGYQQTSDRTHLNPGVQEVDPLGDLQVAPSRVIEGVEIRVRLWWPTCAIRSVAKAPTSQGYLNNENAPKIPPKQGFNRETGNVNLSAELNK